MAGAITTHIFPSCPRRASLSASHSQNSASCAFPPKITTWLSLSSYTHKESRRKPTALLVEMERVTGLEPANESLGSFCLTTWPHPHISIEQYSAYGRSIVDNHHIRQRHRLRTEPRLIDRRPKIYRKHLFKHHKKQSCTVFSPAARYNKDTIEKGGSAKHFIPQHQDPRRAATQVWMSFTCGRSLRIIAFRFQLSS